MTHEVAPLDMPMPAFFDDAACKDAGADLFFPERYDTLAVNDAKAICAECPIILRCRAWALETRQRHGIWGGLTPAERNRIRRHAR